MVMAMQVPTRQAHRWVEAFQITLSIRTTVFQLLQMESFVGLFGVSLHSPQVSSCSSQPMRHVFLFVTRYTAPASPCGTSQQLVHRGWTCESRTCPLVTLLLSTSWWVVDVLKIQPDRQC